MENVPFFDSDLYSFQILLLYQNKYIHLSPGPLRFQDHFLRTGLHAAAAGGQRVRLVSQLRRDRSDVERRLHHPKVHLTLHVLMSQVCLTAALCNFMSTGIFHTDGENLLRKQDGEVFFVGVIHFCKILEGLPGIVLQCKILKLPISLNVVR